MARLCLYQARGKLKSSIEAFLAAQDATD